jgi:hypothetical protein
LLSIPVWFHDPDFSEVGELKQWFRVIDKREMGV